MRVDDTYPCIRFASRKLHEPAIAFVCRRSPITTIVSPTMVYGGCRAGMRWLRQRLSRGRTVHPQSHRPSGRAARVGKHQWHPAAWTAEDEILYYLQSLCPVPAAMEEGAPILIQLLASPAAPASRPGAILGLLMLTAFVLWIASLAVRRMQISYGAEA